MDIAQVAMDPCTACMICEGVQEVDEATQIRAWQSLIDSGAVWSLQGWYGRTAARLIEEGICHSKHTDTEEIHERRY